MARRSCVRRVGGGRNKDIKSGRGANGGNMKTLLAMCGAGLLALTANAGAAIYSQLIVFGDSLSDPGNAAGLTRNADATSFFPPSPPYDQRFSNGKTAAEYLAERFGGTTIPSYTGAANANNYAVGGAMTGSTNFNYIVDSPNGLNAFTAIAATGIARQIAAYTPTGDFKPASTLFLVWGGPNDLLLGLKQQEAGSNVDFPQLLGAAVTNMAGNIASLAQKGASSFLVPNMPDLGLTPRFVGTSNQTSATLLSDAFNAGLHTALGQVRKQLSPRGVSIVEYDTTEFLRDIVDAPPPGISNLGSPCLVGGLAALPSCSGYLFFDDVHPTSFAHKLLAQQFAQAVPESDTYAMLLAGLAMLAVVASRRGAALR